MGIFDRLRSSDVSAKAASKTKDKKTTKPTADKDEAVVNPTNKQISAATFALLRKPHVSEKAAMLSQEENVYVFQVAYDAEKIAIKKAIEQLYSVKVVAVRTIRMQGKTVQRGRRMGARNRWKKALVKLAKGQTLDLYTPAS